MIAQSTIDWQGLQKQNNIDFVTMVGIKQMRKSPSWRSGEKKELYV
ncbi:MAG: hypothetical protein AB8B69_13260 [Chitinophagales bacterium]